MANEIERPAGTEIALMTAEEAREKTDRIKTNMYETRQLLLEIHEREGWRTLGYDNWREYGQVEFGYSETHTYRLMDAAKVERNISPIGENSEKLVKPLPESHLRPLATLDNPELQRAAWEHAVRSAPGGRITAAHVEAVVRELTAPVYEPDDEPAAEQIIDGVAETVDIIPPVEDIGTRVHLETTWTGREAVVSSGVSFIQQQVKIGEMPNQLLLQKRGDRVMVDSFYAAQLMPIDLVGAIVRMFGVDTIIGLAREAAAAIAAETVHVTPSLEEDAEPELAATLGSSEGVSSNGDDEAADEDGAADAGDDEAPDGDDEDQVRIAIPDVFPSPEAAHAWGVQMGAYQNVRQARSAYDGLKFKQHPKSARDMARLWINHCAQWVPELQEVLS